MKGGLTEIVAAGLATFFVGAVHAQIFVAGGDPGPMSEFTMSGQVVSGFGIRNLYGPTGLAFDGNGHLFVANRLGNAVGEYTTSDGTVNASLILPPNCFALALDGHGHVFVSGWWNGTVGEYTTSGAVVNASLISGLSYPSGIALDGNGHLFVANQGTGTIGEFTTSGQPLSPSLISGLSAPRTIALDGAGNLFVVNYGSGAGIHDGSVGEYTTSGAVVNAALISGLNGPTCLALDGLGYLYVGSLYDDSVGKYSTSGTLLDASFITFNSPESIIVVPEPSATCLALFGALLILFRPTGAHGCGGGDKWVNHDLSPSRPIIYSVAHVQPLGVSCQPGTFTGRRDSVLL